MRNCVHGVNANSKNQNQPAEIYSMIRNVSILRYILQYQVILLAGSEGPDQPAQADLGLHCPHMLEDTFSQGAAHIDVGKH